MLAEPQRNFPIKKLERARRDILETETTNARSLAICSGHRKHHDERAVRSTDQEESVLDGTMNSPFS
jgi:hypothetical protein